MKCPHCGEFIPPELILKHRQQELAKRKRPGRKQVPGPNKWGRKGKPKEESK